MTDEMMQANQVPLVERLRSVPANAHLAVNTPNPLGSDTQHFAIGEMCHRAAARLDALEMELEAAKRDAARWLYIRRFVAASEVADWPKWASRGHIESFEETCATVRAIDAAMNKD